MGHAHVMIKMSFKKQIKPQELDRAAFHELQIIDSEHFQITAHPTKVSAIENDNRKKI